jgi:hypothetical protein
MTEERLIGAVAADSRDETVPDPPHSTSMVVWDVPSPAAANTVATVKVGVQCAEGCSLAGQIVELRDQTGAVVGTAPLGSEPSPGTDILHWVSVTFVAPATTGVAFLSAGCTPRNLESPHLCATASFSVRVDAAPEHRVTVRVTHHDTAAPIERVEVRLDHYAAYTDVQGEATLDVPGGRYACTIRRLGYQADPVEIEVTADRVVHIQAGKGETREELEARLSWWENYPWS